MLRSPFGYVLLSGVLLAIAGCSDTDTRDDTETRVDASDVGFEEKTTGEDGFESDASDVEFEEETTEGDGFESDASADTGRLETTSIPPWRRNRPYEVSSKDVSFQSEELEMKGTLDQPEDAPGPVPGVVIVHGSGPNSRVGRSDGQLGARFPETIETYAEIGEYLASRGYAVLRYDKRSCLPINNCPGNGYPVPSSDNRTVRQYVEDAVAALDRLANISGVEADELYVIGHSQGGALAPLIISKRPNTVRGAALLASTPASILETLQYQYDRSLELFQKSGVSKQKAKERLSDTRQAIENLKKLEAGNFDGDRILGSPTSFWRSWLKVADKLPGVVKRANQPMISLSGDYDYNVPPRLARRWKRLFKQGSPRLEHRVVVQDCITHAMNCITDPPQEVQPSDIGEEVAPKVLSRLVEYLDRVHRSLPVASQ